jgi:hypothetical protein
VCTVGPDGITTFFVGVGDCSLTAHVTAGTNYTGADGNAQTSLVGRAAATAPVISDLPAGGTIGGSFVASVATTGDGIRSVTTNTPDVCTVGQDSLTIDYVGAGSCSLSPHVAAGTDYGRADGNAQAFAIDPDTSPISTNPTTPPAPINPTTSPSTASLHGYWLVGSDGGIFSFGSAQFYGSMGGQTLQRPVVGIVPTADRGGYWLDASDGGVFSFGDTRYYGSIPGLGLHPAGSDLPNSLFAPIVGMVPSHDQGGYFMVASDGGVFAFGDATFAGSCPGIGGCAGAAVAVMPDSTGKGYWLVTATGNVYNFGDAPNLGAPGSQSSPFTSAVATPDGKGYWILEADGGVFAYGDATNDGSPSSANFSIFDPANSIFTTSDGDGYWVANAVGKVFAFGDAPDAGDISGTHLNGSIIGASGS